MRRIILAAIIALVSLPAAAQLLGLGIPKTVPTVVSYTGPGDVFSTSPWAWYSCSRGFSQSYAAPGTNPACDVVDTATGATSCTFHVQTNGFVNPTECNATACATACRVTKAYDQTGSGRHVVNATLANMPDITFSSTPKGTLPAITCSSTGANRSLISASTYSQTLPMTFSGVYIRTSGTNSGLLGAGSTTPFFAPKNAAANTFTLNGTVDQSATDNVWHSVQGLEVSTAGGSAVMVDGGTEVTGTTGSDWTTQSIRLCFAQSAEMVGKIAEVGIWAATSTSTDRTNLTNNQKSATFGYNF